MKQVIDKYDLLAEFIRQREEAGHVFGVDEHLQIQKLLRALPEDIPAEKLADYFVPLLATDPEEQGEFHEIFQKCLLNLEEKRRSPASTETPIEVARSLRRWRWVASLAATLLIVVLVIVFWPKPNVQEESGPLFFPFQTEAGGAHVECPDSIRLGNFGVISNAELCDTLSQIFLGEFSIDSTGCLTYSASDSVYSESICAILTNAQGEEKQAFYIITVAERNTSPKLDTIPLPYKHNLNAYFLNLDGNKEFIIQVKIGIILLLGWLIFAVIQAREQERKKLIAQKGKEKFPPYIWEIKTEGERIELNDQFYLALQHMRSRQATETMQLDLHSTILATVKNAGLIDLRYQSQTLPPEYLLLIDRSSASNHRARLYDWLYQAFRDNEVLVERFFYEGDLRRLWNENHPEGWSLPELAHRYSQSRLLILGSGYSLLSPNTGQLAKWTLPVFQQWKQRALLSPQPTRTWSRREGNLAGLFTVLPASLQGLNLAINQFEALEEGAPMGWQDAVKDAAREPIELQGGLLDTLRHYFSEPLVHWIAACAVYPHLHWDLTLYLGRLLSTEEHNLLTVGNLLELTRLSWMVDGKMPVAVRAVLIDFLEREHPALLKQVREGLHGLLQRQELPRESAAYDDLRMQLVLNEWLLTKDKTRKKRLEKEIAELLEAGAEIDLPIVRYLEEKLGLLDFPVPDVWEEYLHPGGYRRLGLRRIMKEFLYFGFPFWLAGSLAAWYWPMPDETSCTQVVPAELDGEVRSICLDELEAYLLWQEHLALHAIDNGDHEKVDSLFSVMPPQPLLDEVEANLAMAYYNQGVSLYNRGIVAQGLETIRDSACFYFGRAVSIDSTINAVHNAGRWCSLRDGTLFESPSIRFQFVPGNRYMVEVNLSGGAPPYHLELWDPNRQLVWSSFQGPKTSLTLDIKPYRGTPGTHRLLVTDSIGYRASVDIPVDPEPVRDIVLRGEVVDPENKPLAGVALRWNGASTGVQTGADGRYEIAKPFQPNADSITFTREGYVSRTRSVAALQRQGRVGLDPVVAPIDTSTRIIDPEMVFVQGGQFDMGCTAEQGSDCYEDEKPPHKVTVGDFWIGKYEVTQAQWRAVMGEDPPELYNKGCDQCPVERVSWNDIQEFLKALNQKTSKKYRLPTESEWEYAARGGKERKGFKYSGSNDLDEVGWYYSNAGDKSRPVGQKKPNELGIFDMSGNVYEWCSDWYGDYPSEAQVNPKGPSEGSDRVGRGGSWNYHPLGCRVSYRNSNAPAARNVNVGFRLARSL